MWSHISINIYKYSLELYRTKQKASNPLMAAAAAEDQESGLDDYTKDGTVDRKGNPTLRSNTGGWIACSFIVGISLLKTLKSVNFRRRRWPEKVCVLNLQCTNWLIGWCSMGSPPIWLYIWPPSWIKALSLPLTMSPIGLEPFGLRRSSGLTSPTLISAATGPSSSPPSPPLWYGLL